MLKNASYEQAIKQYKAKKNHDLPTSSLSDENLLKSFHPDYCEESVVNLQIGPNKNHICQSQLADLLQGNSTVDDNALNAAKEIEADVLVIGGGGAGCTAALSAARKGAKVIITTKLQLGNSNTVMAAGGIQASVNSNDSPQAHFDDTLSAGHFKSNQELVANMVMDGPKVIQWLLQEGMTFDTDSSGNLLTRRPGGCSADRVVYSKDYTGLEMMRTLTEAVLNSSNIKIKNNLPAIELLSDEKGHCAGALTYSMTNKYYYKIKSKAVILATGGIGRTHLNHFPTTNHFGATGDGLVIAYRLGAKLCDLDSFQYHPTTMAFPTFLSGSLITEGIRSAGVYLLNANGERFIDELKPRDCVSAAILRECSEGRGINASSNGFVKGVWLDTPGLELRFPSLLKTNFPKLFRLANKAKINPLKTPLLVSPGLHYQNGGVVIDKNGASTVPGLYCAGEVTGGIHGHNRVMGNALLEIISFGLRAGSAAVDYSLVNEHKKYTLDHLHEFHQNRIKADIKTLTKSPMLFPKYANFNFRSS